MIIEHRVGSLFDAMNTRGSILAHACNAKGVWGSGIAKQLKDCFPDQYASYAWYCKNKSNPHPERTRVGTTHLAYDKTLDVTIACMITSDGYGKDVDSPSQILRATYGAFTHLLQQLAPPVTVHMPRINSGLFGVPWHHTQFELSKVIQCFPDTKVVVWTP